MTPTYMLSPYKMQYIMVDTLIKPKIYIYKVGFFPSYDMWKGVLLTCVLMFFFLYLNSSSFKLLQFSPSISNCILSNPSHTYCSLKFKK